jgi:hypothetical protein
MYDYYLTERGLNHDKSFLFLFVRPTQNWEHEILHTPLFVGVENTDTWPQIMGQSPLRPTQPPLGQIHYLAQIRLGLWFDCLGAKSPLSI